MLTTTKLGIALFITLTGGTALALLPQGQPVVAPAPTPILAPVVTATGTDGVKLTVKPSQTKVVQRSLDEVYLDIGIEVPSPTPVNAARRPADLILVLDRSGSMGDERKLDYAKAAIRAFADRLAPQDRLALVGFDDTAVVEFPLASLAGPARLRFDERVNTLGPGGGTNMGEGLERGGALLGSEGQKDRSTRVVLLSDGNANAGISTPEGLTSIVKAIGRKGAVVSAIGMGLDFNETLLARLADHGMGNYSYLASLDRLGQLLEKDLGDARAQFAGASHLLLQLGPGVTVTDAAGYPLEQTTDGRVMIPLGQLLEGAHRNVTVALKAPTAKVGPFELAGVDLTYERNGVVAVVKGSPNGAKIAMTVVEPARGAEAIASIDSDVLKKTWITNNAGRMQKDVAGYLRDGKQVEARAALNNYRNKIDQVQKETGVKTDDAGLAAELAGLDARIEDAFKGSYAEQEQKKKAYSKAGLSSSISAQRMQQKH